MNKAVGVVKRLETAFHREMLASKPGSARARRFADAATTATVIVAALKHPKIVTGLIRVMRGKK